MILEERNYLVVPGGAAGYLRIWQESGRPAQERILGACRGVWLTEVGELNTIVFHWAYPDLAERSRRRAILAADAEFAGFREQVRGVIVRQANRILVSGPAGAPVEAAR